MKIFKSSFDLHAAYRRIFIAPILLILGLVFFVGFFFFETQATRHGGATLFIGPTGGTFTVGSTFNVSLYLNTGGNFANALEAYLSFPPDKLQIVSPTAGKSFIQIWTNQPTFSNRNGTLTFQGGVHTPGINTESGIVSTITFRVRDTGTAAIRLLDNSRVFLADGKGTNILSQTSGALYQLTLPPPAGPFVTSPTNPDPEKWYATKNTVFRWEPPPDIQGYSYILNSIPVDEPDSISEGLRTVAVYEGLSDGIYYFHIKSLRSGVWGGVTHYQAKVDNTPPATFRINISPRDYTSNRRPILTFATTDAISGLDHYELKIISLDPPTTEEAEANTYGKNDPFFIEAVSPYSERLEFGRYDVVVRAYDRAGNHYQAQARLSIVNPIFEIVRGQGLRLWGTYVVTWPYVLIIALVFLALFVQFARVVWGWHREIETHLSVGALKHPSVVHKFEGLIKKLKEKQKDYGKHLVIWGLLAIAFGFGVSHITLLKAQEGGTVSNVTVEPPVVTLFPKEISNDEILYIGGRAGAPEAEVIINLQRVDTGSTLSQIATTDKTGAWFYSFPQFLTSGRYLVWTQLRVGDELSLPSPQFNLTVAPTAIQIGSSRLSYQNLYFVLVLIFAMIILSLLGFIFYHSYHFRAKKSRLFQEIKEAEESIRRGFSVLRRDIEAELAVVRKAKLSKELAVEEKLREEKLLKDLEWVNNYIGKEVWEIEEAEKKF